VSSVINTNCCIRSVSVAAFRIQSKYL